MMTISQPISHVSVVCTFFWLGQAASRLGQAACHWPRPQQPRQHVLPQLCPAGTMLLAFNGRNQNGLRSTQGREETKATTS